MNMKTFTSLLIGCALALAGAAMAQQPEEQATPKEKAATEKTHVSPPKSGANAAQSQETTAKPEATAAKQRGATHERATSKALKTEATPKSATSTATETNVSGEPGASATPGAKQGAERRKGTRATNAKASPSATAATKASPSATAAAAATASATPVTAATASATPVTAATASAAPTVAGAGQTNAQANAAGAAKKPDPQQVQQIKQQHTNFRAQPKPQQVPAVTFNQSYRIEGSDRWQGRQYEAFRSYHPERHDQGWYRSHYNRVELIGGGYYYWNNGYWYPAWGYSPSAEYYAYDGPIYVGQRAEPPDRVIADVQAVLQQMGYYKGDVDGLLGPLTRQALTAYQADQGLTATAAIDEPTLDSLGMG
jgi:hypothetical protein